MNYDVFEIGLIALAMNHPTYLARIDKTLIEREDLAPIIDAMEIIYKEHNSTVSLTAIRSRVAVADYLVQSINVELSGLIKKTDDEIKDFFSDYNKHLLERHHTREMIRHADNIKKLAKNGQITASISYAKGIRFINNEPLKSTKEIMQDSLFEFAGFKTGIDAIDRRMGGFLLGNIVSIIGASGSMKTMVSLWMTLQILKENPGYTALYFEKEMPVADIARRMITNMLQIENTEIMRIANQNKLGNPDELHRLMLDINKALALETNELFDRIKVVPSTKFNTASDMHSIIDQYRPQIWVLDFLTMLGDGATDNLYNFHLESMNKLKDVVHSTNSCGIILGQIKQNVMEQKKCKVPMTADAEFGSKLHQYSAFMFSTFYPKFYYSEDFSQFGNRYYLYNLKNRNAEPIHVPLISNPAMCEFKESNEERAYLDAQWLEKYIKGTMV